MGPDGQLYVGLGSSGNILRVLNPKLGTTQVVESIGTTVAGKSVNGLAFIGNDLYIAQQNGLSRIVNATRCLALCQAEWVSGSASKQTYWAITADKIANTLYVAYGSQVKLYNPATIKESLVVGTGIYPDGSLQPFKFSGNGAGLTLASVNGIRTLWIGDNVATGLPFEGRLWKLPLQ